MLIFMPLLYPKAVKQFIETVVTLTALKGSSAEPTEVPSYINVCKRYSFAL